jgi:hypothetical protein
MLEKVKRLKTAFFLIITILVTAFTLVGDEFPAVLRSPLYIVRRGDKLGFMNRQGQIVIPPRFDNAEDFFEGVARVNINGQWAFIDENGSVLFRLPNYTLAWSFDDGLAMVEIKRPDEVDGHRGYIDHTGKLVIPLRFRSGSEFSEGLAAVENNRRKWGYINRQGKWVIQPQFDQAQNFRKDWATVKVGWYEGVIDKSGKFVIPPNFVLIGRFEGELACARPKDSQQWGLINRSGTLVVSPKLDWCDGFHNGFARVQVGGKWGYINAVGDIVVTPKFDEAGRFDEDVAPVKVGNKWGVINLKGDFVIEPQYLWASGFVMGLAVAEIADRMIYIDHGGNIIQILRFKDADDLVQ